MGKNKNKQKRNPPKNGFQSAHAPAADTNRNNREEPNMSFATESGPENVVTIKVVGVGGAGNNVVNRMVKSGTQGIEYVAVNTDKQALAVSSADQKIQIGEKLTHGQGAGSDPDVGKRSAEESRNNIAKSLENADMVFITAGMGGGTGTGAAPVVAETAHDLGILTVGIVTKPFAFEGKRKMAQAEQGIASLMMHVDSLIVIPNERLKLISQEKITLMNAFEAADNVLRQGVESISSLINIPAFINLDFADVRSIMKDAGFAHMGVGVAKGAGKAENAAKAAISSPLLETSIAGARGVIINITSSPDIGLEDVETAASMITQSAHPDANIIWGTAFDERLSDEMSITVVATGFESTPEVEEPIQAHVDAKRAAQASAQPAAQPAAAPVQPVQPVQPQVSPVMPNPIFTQSFSTGMDTPVAAQPAAPAEEEDDGDYFDDLLSILNKRS